jgi:UDP-N-acetyl-D-galactosamine dehydrogenase
MGEYVADRVVKLMTRRGINVVGSRILVLGLAFKENCPDIRNTKVVDLIGALASYNARVDVHDPWVCNREAQAEYGIQTTAELVDDSYDAVVLAVAHRQFVELGAERIRRLAKAEHVFFDIKHAFPKDAVTARL